MMKSRATFFWMLFLMSPLTDAGMVMDMVTRNASGQETNRSKIYAQSKMIRIDEVGGPASEGTMIFRDNELVYVDHRDKSYMVMDEAMMEDMSVQISDAMKQMEAELAKMPNAGLSKHGALYGKDDRVNARDVQGPDEPGRIDGSDRRFPGAHDRL